MIVQQLGNSPRFPDRCRATSSRSRRISDVRSPGYLLHRQATACLGLDPDLRQTRRTWTSPGADRRLDVPPNVLGCRLVRVLVTEAASAPRRNLILAFPVYATP